jgi:hypothetical protein
MSQNQQEENNPPRIYLIIIGVETLLIILLSILFFTQKTRIETVEKEKLIFVERAESLQTDLDKLKGEYEMLKTSDARLQAELDQKIKMIDSLMVLAKKHEGDAYMIHKLTKETETLRRIMKHFVQQIDSLGRLNKEIIAETNQVQNKLDEEKGKTKQLTAEKEDLQNTVSLGMVLKANNLRATGVRYRSGGKKELETKSAKRVEKIKITLSLGENRIAKSGERIVYARIVTPDGKELAKSTDESNMFTFNNSKGFFAAKTTVSYNNSDTFVALYTAKTDVPFLPGKYLIEVVTDKAVIGQTELILE